MPNTPIYNDENASPVASRPAKRPRHSYEHQITSFSVTPGPSSSNVDSLDSYEDFWSSFSLPRNTDLGSPLQLSLPSSSPTSFFSNLSSTWTPEQPGSMKFQTPLTPTSHPPLRKTRSLQLPSNTCVENSHDILSASGSNRKLGSRAAGVPESLPLPTLDSLCAPFKPLSRNLVLDSVLQILRHLHISPLELVSQLVDLGNKSGDHFRRQWYSKDCPQLDRLLDGIAVDPRGKAKLNSWMEPRAVDIISRTIDDEMQAVQNHLHLPSVNSITPAFLDEWNKKSIIEPVVAATPTLMAILLRAAETSVAKEKNKKKHANTMCGVILLQLAKQRSNLNMKFAAPFGLFLWSTGCQRKTIDVLFCCGLSISYDSILKLINNLANHCVAQACIIARSPHMNGYDNLNLKTSIFVEQRGADTPRKVQSGTFSVIYQLRYGDGYPMQQLVCLQPILDRAKACSGLDYYADLRPTIAQCKAVQREFSVLIVHTLLEFCPGFDKSYSEDPLLQPVAQRPLPKGYKTRCFPLRTSTIEEATVEGNLAVHEDIYINQLKFRDEDLSGTAILTVNDGLTNQRIRAAQLLRSRDVNSWTRREIFQIGIGLFHMCLNLVWALLQIHRGSLSDLGSLTYFFVLMEKTRLGAPHPDYHTLLSALMQILNGLILESWRCDSGFTKLKDFSASCPSAEKLLGLAEEIINNYASPLVDDTEDDHVHRNIRLLFRDLLYVSALVRAISAGDFGCVELILPQLAMIFRGAGSNNYCAEILHLILNLKHIWTPEYANIVRDNIIVNPSGLQGHAMGVDLNAEHGIGSSKAHFAAKGIYSSWDRLGDVTACIVEFDKNQRQVCDALGTHYYGSSHTTPDTSKLVWRVADKARELGLLQSTPGREGNSFVKPWPDLYAVGERKLRSSSLDTFNKKHQNMMAGRYVTGLVDDDVDELPLVALALDDPEE
ncbi:hypothetical protein EVG20_g10773 [Dentipellis fragilis]|uniref:DUF6589 domain-containing protein n=1 Tax=Dentipellis fragilis TaxID=205917 RepID=A0A4Y9XQ94_9AGAM|nr:hypothetical protein EVG20_g10773 [Dentipellis fragilis]